MHKYSLKCTFYVFLIYIFRCSMYIILAVKLYILRIFYLCKYIDI